MSEKPPEKIESVEGAIHVVRGSRVMLDADLARFYGVATKQLNQARKRNADRFPDDFAFQLTAEELTALRSQIVTSKPNLKSQFVTSKDPRGGRRSMPWVFTEHGVLMLASVLNSEIAIAASVRIVRVFVRLREMILSHTELSSKLAEAERRLDKHDEAIAALFAAVRQLLNPPVLPKPEIGFHVREEAPRYRSRRVRTADR